MSKRNQFILGLGSNLGNRALNLKKALIELSRRDFLVEEISQIYESEALLPPGAPKSWNLEFWNLAVRVSTLKSAQAVLHEVKRMELYLGRRPGQRWAPREIDLDLLLWENENVQSDVLEIPHPALRERAFALKPLAEVVPRDWHDPVRKTSTFKRSWKSIAAEKFPSEREARVLWKERWRLFFPELVGILNLTPDSFSDGGRFVDPELALDEARRVAEAGASVIDLGAESTRPGGSEVDIHEELRRLSPVILNLKAMLPALLKVSLDCRHPQVIRRLLEVDSNSLDWINDVGGFREPEMLKLARDFPEKACVAMHSLSLPVLPGEFLPLNEDVVSMVKSWWHTKRMALEREGIEPRRLIFDPGIGFGKACIQNWDLIRDLNKDVCDEKFLFGHSRKSFLSVLTDRKAAERDAESLGVSLGLSLRGAWGPDYLRVHDVEGHRRVFQAMAQTMKAFTSAADVVPQKFDR